MELERRRRTEYAEPLLITCVCAALHDRKGVQVWSERGYEARSALFVYSPLNKHVYGDIPEIQALVANAVR